MSIAIGRLGYMGIAIEASPGSSTAPAAYIPYTDVSLRGHHEPIEAIYAKTSRIMDSDSVLGKRWGEGDITMDLDNVNSGYLWLCALGKEALSTGTPNYHTFYPSVSGNLTTGSTASLTFGRDTDNERYTHSMIDELTVEVSDGMASLTSSWMTNFPSVVAASTPTTTSGTLMAFKDLAVQFGSNLTTAAAAGTTAVNSWSMTIANNLEVIHRSGSSDPSLIRTKGLRISGSYTLFFDSVTDRDAYYALSKRAMIATFTCGTNETVRIRVPQFRLSEGEISTGLDDFFVINCDWVAEDEVDSGVRLVDVRLGNTRSSLYSA
jgi:hypothetical protein